MSKEKKDFNKKETFRKIIESIKNISLNDIEKAKYKFNRQKRDILRDVGYLGKLPSNVEIAQYATPQELEIFGSILSIKPTRTSSGVNVVAVMSKPHKCPHGKCLFCAGGVESVFGDVPQSYTGKEPATIRAIRNDYDPYFQVMNRLEQYVVLGNNPSKIELIIMGGTFPSLSQKYQEEYTNFCFKAMNDFSRLFYNKNKFLHEKFRTFLELPGDINSKERLERIKSRLLIEKKKNLKTLEYEQKYNEISNIRCVGLTLETRSDTITVDDAAFMLKLGCTRVELGIQSIYDDALKFSNRAHTTKDNIFAIKTLRNLGFKLNFHMMPGLPNVSKKQDINSLVKIFEDSDYMPDMLKIYPCMVIRGTQLYDLYKQKKYTPLTTKKATEIIVEMIKKVPKYCRIMRVQRDIPTYMTEAGVDKTNLRQYLDEELKNQNIVSNDIRAREPKGNVISKNIKLNVLEYEANEGKEFFISIDDIDNNYILGFCRMRFPSEFLRKEITTKSALIRELHVYGSTIMFGKKGLIQHTGLGSKLLKKAEDIAKKNNKEKIVIISGVGVREYYRKKHNYKKQGPYMVKKL